MFIFNVIVYIIPYSTLYPRDPPGNVLRTSFKTFLGDLFYIN